MNKEQIARYMKFTKTKLDVRAAAFYILLLFCAVAYSAIFDEFRTGAITSSPSEHAVLIFTSTLYSLALFFLLMISRWVFIFTAPILFYIGAVGHIYVSKLGLPINIYSAPRFFSNEALTEIVKSTPDAIYIIAMFFIGLAAGLVRFFSARDESTVRKGQAFAVILILAAGATRYVAEKYPTYTPMPFAYFGAMQNYTSSLITGFFLKPTADVSINATAEDNVTTVVIFIERFSDEYLTDAMPLISMESPMMMKYAPTTLSAAEELYKVTTGGALPLISTLKNAGMPVEWINISNIFTTQHPFSTTVAKSAERQNFKMSPLFPNPFLAVDYIDEFLSRKQDGLLIINIEGVPQDVSLRYQEIFAKPTLNEETDAQRNYKNYTASLDAFISEVIKKLKTRKAVLFVIALEDEKLSETDSPAVILWISNVYAEKLNIKRTKEDKQGYTLNAEQVGAAILACSKIKTEKSEDAPNLCK